MFEISDNEFAEFPNNIVFLRMNLKFFAIVMNDKIVADEYLMKIQDLI